MNCACCWEDYDNIAVIAEHGHIEICTVPWSHLDPDGISSGVRHFAWLCCEEVDAPQARQLAVHLLAAADHLDQLNQQTAGR